MLNCDLMPLGVQSANNMAASLEQVLDNHDEFGSKELGEKEHWDEVYMSELNCFRENGDVGQVWFGYDCMNRIICWLETNFLVHKNDKILDIGCGNGLMLVELFKKGFTDLSGVDYSQGAIELCKSIAEKSQVSVNYQIVDILDISDEYCLQRLFAICIDKGTFDAISLYSDNASSKRKIYVENVYRLLQKDGLFILTSCNWTKEELLNFITPGFTFIEDIPAPKIQFGGKKGSPYASLIFKKSES